MNEAHVRPCNHCGFEHRFTTDIDDRETCPRCGGELYPIATERKDTAQLFRLNAKGAIIGHGFYIPPELQIAPGHVQLDIRLLNALYSAARAEAFSELAGRDASRDEELRTLKAALVKELDEIKFCPECGGEIHREGEHTCQVRRRRFYTDGVD